MPIYADDNFGVWDDMDDPDMQRFYEEVQKKSVLKKCSICGREVYLLPHYDKCDSCMDKIERGYDLYG